MNKENYPDKIYATKKIGTNGIHCLDYRNEEEDVEYAKVGNVAKPNACPQLADVQTDGVCFICKKPTQNLSPDPTNWRIDLPFNGGNGLTRQYHQGCIVALIDKHFVQRESLCEVSRGKGMSYQCMDCGTEINEGEFKTFGVCDGCWDKAHPRPADLPEAGASAERISSVVRSADTVCPFCGESGFDLIGLKSHISNGDCEQYNNTENIQRVF